jgi:serine/threonine protein kinase
MVLQNKSQVPIGAILGGKFRVTREIGRGGMAAVYEAENVVIGKRVAVKVLAAELITSRVVRERFIREARAAAAIRSPYICDVYDSGMFDERPFLVMELLEGESLYDLTTRIRRLDASSTLRISVQTCRGLSKAHEANVIHRDLKPENIFLTKNEDGHLVAKLLDFGLAKFYEPMGDASSIRLTREGALFGTPAYMSPEQAKGQGEVDHRADLWALGCIVYECLTGQTVWDVDQGVAMILAQIANSPLPKPSRLRPDLPPAFDLWFAKALDRDPNRRFQTASEFAETLSGALLSGESRARSPSLQTAEEADRVDQLISDAASTGASREGEDTVGSSPRPPLRASAELDVPAGKSSALRAVAALSVVAAIALGGYALWLYVLNAPVTAGPVEPGSSASAQPAASGSASAAAQPLEREPYALQINSAQLWLSKGNQDNALKGFREAFSNGGSGVARALLNHASVLSERGDAPCKLTGLGRPRPFDITVPSSRPALAFTESGSVVVWVDNHLEAGKRQAYSVLLDGALSRVSMTRAVTPEAESARSVEIVPAGKRLALAYADRAERGETQPGVYVRALDRDGRIAGKAEKISRNLPSYQLNPSVGRGDDDTLWVVWEDEFTKGARDLVARHLDAELKPLGPELRLTALRPTPGMPTVVETPVVAVAQGHLEVAFVLERAASQRQIMLLRAPLGDKALETGLGADADTKRGERTVGKLQALSDARGKLALPRMTCVSEGCFIVWDDENGGAFAAFVEPAKGEKLWHREFGARGTRPGLGSNANTVMVAWYEEKRLKLAALTRDGLGPPSVIGRVNGYQPNPLVVPGKQAGEWYVAWRDYEAGHLETFVARAQCR